MVPFPVTESKRGGPELRGRGLCAVHDEFETRRVFPSEDAQWAAAH